MDGNSAYAESPASQALSAKEREIYGIVLESWPTSALGVAEHFRVPMHTREAKKQASTKYAYYLHKLVARRLLVSKRIGNALVVWPLHTEKYRTIHSILKE
ncbi:MAG: hypothetical protein V1676_02460 [Candidatus Diapherotrites archaeon]